MLKILLPQSVQKSGPDARFVFDIHQLPVEYTFDKTQSVDINATDDYSVDARLNLDWGWAFSYQYDQCKKLEKQLEKRPDNTVSLTVASASEQHPRVVHWDMCFCRTKAYYTQFPVRHGTERIYWHDQKCFISPDLRTSENKKKIFVAPCQTRIQKYNERLDWITPRKHLSDLLSTEYSNLGYVGNYTEDKNKFLYAHLDQMWIDDFDANSLEKETRPPSYDWWGYAPPHNAYYTNTFISFYGESVEYGNELMITEKTYDPMVKGHFILPCGIHGFVKSLKQKGILFPDFIDYSYDDVADDFRRVNTWIDEVKRLCDIPLEQWKLYWDQNYELLYQNKLWVYNTPYPQVNFVDLIKKFGKS